MAREIRQWIWIGVDLGQRRDSSAIAVVERIWEQTESHEFVYSGSNGRWRFRVRMLERLRLDTSYPDVVERVRQITRMPQVMDGRTVVVDGTGVGAPVVDLLRRAELGCMIVPVIITGGGGHAVLRGGYESVARAELLTAMQVLVQQGKLEVPVRSRWSEVLRREMLGLKLAGSPSATDGQHDDLAFAVALALWKARVGTR